MSQMQGRLADIILKNPNVLGVQSSVGQAQGGVSSTNSGRVIVRMKPLAERADSVDETIEQLRKAVKVIPLLQVFFQNRPAIRIGGFRSEEHTSELQSLMRISYAVFCLK